MTSKDEVKVTTTKAADVKPAEKTVEVKKPVEKAVEEKKPVEKKAAEVKEAAKAATKTATTKAKETAKATKTTAKKTVAKVAAKTVAVKAQTIVQYQNHEVDAAKVEERVKAQFVSEGHKAASIKKMNIYIKPEEYSAYYVINDKFAGRVDLF